MFLLQLRAPLVSVNMHESRAMASRLFLFYETFGCVGMSSGPGEAPWTPYSDRDE
jgi:hypothetical protein